MGVNITNEDRDDTGAWVGRTMLVDRDELVSALFSAVRTRNPVLGLPAEVMLSWNELGIRGHDPQDGHYIPVDDYQSRSDDPEFTWHPTAPPEPRRTAPIPLNLLLPMADCPVPELSPWWDPLRIAQLPPEGTVAGFQGTTLHCGTTKGRFSWDRGTDYDSGMWSYLYAGTDRLTAAVTLRAVERKISGPGTLGSLVPGYSDLRGLASAISERTQFASLGCTLAYRNIHAIEAHISYQSTIPKIGAHRDQYKHRGYGPCERFEVAFETSDGWRPYRIGINGDTLSFEIADTFLPFATWLVSAIAYDRLAQPWATGTHATELTALMDTPPQPRETHTPGLFGSHTFQFRQEIPGYVPITD